MSWQMVTVANKQQFITVWNVASELFKAGKKADIQIREHEENRKEAQNKLQFHWFREMEMQGDKSANEWRSQCKLELGVPLARESDSFRSKYDSILKALPYETKLALMAEPFNMEVTRNFSIKKMTRYLHEVEQFAAKCGFRLTTNEDLYYQAMGLAK